MPQTPLDPTKVNPVAPADQLPSMPKQTDPNMDLVSGPSEYSGLPKHLAKILEASKPNKSIGARMLNADLPRYAYQLGAGATEAATFGIIDAKENPTTTGEALVRGFGHLYGAFFNPTIPAVGLAAKTGKLGATAAGALANMAAAEIETKGQASKGRLALEGVFGAVFGRLYGRQLEEAGKGFSAAYRTPKGVAEDIATGLPAYERPRPAPPPAQEGPKLLEDLRGRQVGRPDFYAGESRAPGPGEFPYETTGLRGERVLPPITTAPYRPQVEPTSAEAFAFERGSKKGLAVYGEGLFKEAGMKAKPGEVRQLTPKGTQKLLNRMKWSGDKNVRESANMVETFLKHSDDIPEGMPSKVAALRKGEGFDVPEGIKIKPWEDPYEIGITPRNKLPTGITGLSKFRPPEYVFADVEKETGGRVKAYSMFWDGAIGRNKARVQIGKEGYALAQVGKGLENDDGLLGYFKTNDSIAKMSIAQAGEYTPTHIDKGSKIMSQVEALWDRNFPETPFNRYMTEILPALGKMTPMQVQQTIFDPAVDSLVKWAASHEMSFRENNIVQFAAQHIRALSMKEHFDPHFNAMMKIASDRTYPEAFRNYVAEWARNARGTQSLFAQKWNPVVKKMFARLGADPNDIDIRDFIDNYITLTHAGLVGFRPGPVIRNMFNAIQTGGRIGVPWLYKGMKTAMTDAGWERARLAGMIDEASHEMEALRELAAPGKITRGIRKVAAAGLKHYGKVDDYNRAAIYLGMEERFLDAANKSKGDIEKLKSLSGLYNFHPAIRDHVINEFTKNGAKKAAELAGIHAAQATQWVYRSEYRPLAMTGDMSRAFFQFGVWPINYMEYTGQMLRTALTDHTVPHAEKWKWMRDFVLLNASIVGAIGATGATVGLGAEAAKNAMGWTYAGPLQYQGGPALDTLFALPRLARDLQNWELGDAVQTTTYNRVKANLAGAIPGMGLARDISRARGPIYEGMQEVPVVGDLISATESKNVLPAENIQQELMRFAMGLGVRNK